MKRLLAVALLLSLLLLSCGDGGKSEVTVQIASVDPSGQASRYYKETIVCPGDNDCELLNSLPDKKQTGIAIGQELYVLDPLPKDAVCSRQGGPPVVGKISGTVEGQEVDAVFPAFRGGCEANRWQIVYPLFEQIQTPPTTLNPAMPG